MSGASGEHINQLQVLERAAKAGGGAGGWPGGGRHQRPWRLMLTTPPATQQAVQCQIVPK